MKLHQFIRLVIALPVLLLVSACATGVTSVQLVEAGHSNYVIVTGSNHPYDAFAANELQRIVEKSTGCTLTAVAPDAPEAAKAGHRILVGHCPQSRALLGDARIDGLKQGESLVTCVDGDIIIVGGGNHGASYGVFHFLEKGLGYRCFTPFDDGELIPAHKNVVVSSEELTESPAFDLSRMAYMLYLYTKNGPAYQYRNRGVVRYKCVSGEVVLDGRENSDFPMLDTGHGFHLYITTERTKTYYEWDEQKDYFKTNPEYFSLDRNGDRTPKLQLCFSNPELRKELTRRIIERGKRQGGHGILTLGANDWPGPFCFCPECKALAEKYDCTAGPLYDYMLEACPEIAKALPAIRISTLAYRKKQSEVPPTGIDRMPDNWICDFAPVDDDQGQSLDGERNLDTLKNLKAWSRITPNITYWYYICINSAPFGLVDRLSRDMKVMHENGVRGVGVCGLGSPGMFPMQEYIMFRLMIDPYQDPWTLVEEYNRHQYGDAAPEMTQYVKELEEVWREPKRYIPLSCPGKDILAFTPERLLRWQAMFETLEKKLAGKPDRFSHNLSLARWDIDMLTLTHYPRIIEALPDCNITPKQVIERMRQVDLPNRYRGQKLRERSETVYLTCVALSKPIPAPLDKLPPGRVIQLPQCGGQYPFKDPDAACGEAKTQPLREDHMATFGKKIGFDIYDTDTKHTLQHGEVDIAKCTPGKYELYRVAKTTIPRGGLIAFDVWWGVRDSLGPYYPEGDEFREFEIWASLKFVGPSFGIETDDGKDRMFCDRMFIVKLTE